MKTKYAVEFEIEEPELFSDERDWVISVTDEGIVWWIYRQYKSVLLPWKVIRKEIV